MDVLYPDFSEEVEEAKIRPYNFLSPETQSAHDDYLRRLRFCKNNGVNTVIFTGDG